MTERADPTVIRYERQGDTVRLTLTNVTNHELREVLVGLWCRLDRADRLDHLRELLHDAHDADAWLSPVAAAIKTAGAGGEGQIDLGELAARGEKVKP
jgi:hypothetical protein